MADKSANRCRRTDGGQIKFWCPGCGEYHYVHVEGVKPWDFNGNLVEPTFYPSVKVSGTVPVTDEEISRIMAGVKIDPVPTVCHSYVRDGHIEFLSDCTHALAGQTVRMKTEGE